MARNELGLAPRQRLAQESPSSQYDASWQPSQPADDPSAPPEKLGYNSAPDIQPKPAQDIKETTVRVMLKVSIPVERGNSAVTEGALKKVVEEALERLKPEAAYFLPENGVRTAMMFFDLADQSEIPSIAEPFFHAFNAAVSIVPVMNADDLRKGLAKLS